MVRPNPRSPPMEPKEEDTPAAYLPHPIDPSADDKSPPPAAAAEDDGGDVAVVGAYDMGDSHLLSSPFPLAPTFEPTEPDYDDAAGEEAPPMSVEAADRLLGSPIAQAPALQQADPSFDEAAGEEVAGEEALPVNVEAAPPGPVKRKRGRPPKNHGAGGRAPAPKRKDEEEVCFICFDGGNLVVCDRRGCPKVYHPTCINRDEAFFRSRSRWNCGWHICSICEKAATYMCCTCTYSLCKVCIREARFFCVRGYKGFCETCYKTIMLIESNGQANEEKVRVDFDDRNSWEYLFKVYWLTLKGKMSLTSEELSNAKNPWKGSGTFVYNEETSDELYNANDDQEASSDSSSIHHEGSISSRKKVRRRPRKSADGERPAKSVDSEKKSLSEDGGWASPELLEFVSHMKDGDESVLSQFDVQALLLEYIKRNNLRDPRRKSQIVCDTRLKNLFGKARVGHFEMLKLLESHFLIKEASQIGTDDNQGVTVDSDYGQMDAEEYNNTTSIGSDKRRKARKRVGERELQFNLDDYAALDVHNVNMIYLRRSLMENLIDDDNFSEKVVGSFVRIRISGASQKQDMYRLVQVMGTHVVAEKYKVGKKTTDIALEILNLDKMEILSIDAISNQEFTEEECRRLRQSIKCGLISRLTVGDLLEKAKVLQEVRVNDWLENEKSRLSHLRDRASDLGRRKELRECIEKLQILSTPEERQRRVSEVPEVHVDPHMDPSYESPEEAADDKKEDNFNRSREPLSRRKGKKLLSPGRGSISSFQWNDTAKSSKASWLSNRIIRTEVAEDRIEALVALGDRTNQLLWNESNVGSINSLETPKAHTLAKKPEASIWNGNQLVTKVEHPYGIAPESMISSSGVPVPSNGSESDKVWQYQDPSGRIQGPFSILQLRKWSSTGYFPSDLRIWQTSQKQEESVLLTNVLPKFLKDSPRQEPQPTSFASAAVNTGHNWDIGWREKNNSTFIGIKQNESPCNVSQNDIAISASGYNGANVDTWSPQASNYSEPKRELISPQEGRIGGSARVWESPKDTNAWYGQPTSCPSPRFSVPFSGNPCNSPVYQVIGAQAENAERWSRNQDLGSSWSSIRSRPLRPSGYEDRHSSWSPSSQQSHQVSTQYQKIQPANNSRSQWVNDAYGPPTPTPQPGSMDCTSDGCHMRVPSASVSTSVQLVSHGWEAAPSAELHQSATVSMEPKGNTSTMTSVGGWGSNSCSNVLNQMAAHEGWGSESAASIADADADANQNLFGKVGDLGNPSWTNQQKKPFDFNAIASSGIIMKKNQFFESSCPSPTPSSERDDSPPFQMNEPDPGKKWNEACGTPAAESQVVAPVTVLGSRPFDPNVPLSAEVDSTQSLVKSKDEVADKVSEIEKLASLSSETQNNHHSLAGVNDKLGNLSSSTMPVAKPDALDSDSVQKSEALAGSKLVSELNDSQHEPHICISNVASSGGRLDRTQTENSECFSGPEYVSKDMKSTRWSLLSPTSASEHSGWNLAVDSSLGKNQSDALASSDGVVSGTFTEPAALRNPASPMAEDAADKGWVIAPQDPNIGGPAHGSESLGWGKTVQVEASTNSGVMAQVSANVAWGTAHETSTGTGWIMPGQKSTHANTGWVTSAQGNGRIDSGWVAEGNMNPNGGWGVRTASSSNSGWGATIKASSDAGSGWGVTATGNTNQNPGWSMAKQHVSNTGWGTALGNNAIRSSATGYDDISVSQRWHGGDRYHEGRELGRGGGSNPRNRAYLGGAGAGAGGSSHALRGQGLGQGQGQGQRGVCKFYESGHCKKGASCNYLHP